MKKLIVCGLFLGFIFTGCGDKRLAEKEMPWHDRSFAQAQEAADSEQLMLFFETEW